MENMNRLHIRPARPDEAGLFYTPHPEEDRRRGTIGHVRMDFGRSGNEFWHTWWPRGPEELNSPAFKAELQEVADTMREDVLKSRFAMERFCYLSRIEQNINDNGFTTRRATEQDLKKMLGVYFEQNVTTEKFEDFDGDRWVIVGE